MTRERTRRYREVLAKEYGAVLIQEQIPAPPPIRTSPSQRVTELRRCAHDGRAGSLARLQSDARGPSLRLSNSSFLWTSHVERAPLPPSPPVTLPRALPRGIRASRRPRAQKRFAGVVVGFTTDAEQFGPNRERCRREGGSGFKGPPSSSRRCVVHLNQCPHTASRLPKRCTHDTHALSRMPRCCACPRAEPIVRAIGTRCCE